MGKIKKPIINAYYFPNWHQDPRNDVWHGTGWTEWNLVKHATPRFPGHKQPKEPIWGYEDEADCKVMERKIKTASEYGIGGFIFDWYWYDDGPFRNRCLEEGFLSAANTNDMKFSVMWANETFVQVHPGSRMFPKPVLKSGFVSPQTFFNAADHCISKYFCKPNYLRIDGGLYFSIYLMDKMIEQLGGIEAAAGVFREFRKRVYDAGLGEINLNVVNLPERDPVKANTVLKALGVNSMTSYVWDFFSSKDFPDADYTKVAEAGIKNFNVKTQFYDVPYYPIVCMGWDPSPRSVQSEIYEKVGYPFTTVFVNNTPAEYGKALEAARDFILSGKATGKMINLSCWNEWTEGNYLEPDTENGYGYLEEIKRVFGK